MSVKLDTTTMAEDAVTPAELRKDVQDKGQWNTKNLGLRLASDFAGAASAAVMVAPLITIIDK
jgi:hypothetical protein